jgi:predicted metal-dependent HD superfamily phosphohydrolase
LITGWLRALGANAPTADAIRIAESLLARWGEPHRSYHNAEHLTTVLSIVDSYGDRAADLDAVRLAAWYHDAVYDPRRVDNEEASALLAESQLPPLGVHPERVAEVARLVRLTAGHDPIPGDRNGALLTDADLAILAATAEAYRDYARAIRAEYAHVPEAAFHFGRAAVLEGLLALPRLFHTPELRTRWEEPARRNISGELAQLRDHPIPA